MSSRLFANNLQLLNYLSSPFNKNLPLVTCPKRMPKFMEKRLKYCNQRTSSQLYLKSRFRSCWHKSKVIDKNIIVVYINMSDNYQFDKNSKLFQKFLAQKANKNNDSFAQKQLNNQSAIHSNPKTQQPSARITQVYQNKSQVSTFLAINTNCKGPLHVTVDDIEEAASEALNESSHFNHQIEKNQIRKQSSVLILEENKLEQQKDYSRPSIDSLKQNQYLGFAGRNERNRQRRTRQFQSKPYPKLQIKQEKPSKAIQQQEIVSFQRVHQEKNPKIQQRQVSKQKQNIELNTYSTFISKRSEQMSFTLGSKENDYMKKIQKLNEKNEELKQLLQQEKKDKQKIINEKQSEIQTIKDKYYQLRSNEDTLSTELKRYKQRLQSQNLVRTRLEQELKQLNFRILQLQQVLEGKQSNIKKRTDEIAYWKNQHEQIKNEMKQILSQVQAYEEKCQFLDSQNKILHKDIIHKENLIQEVRKNVNILIQENTIAKDQIYRLTIKLYQIQQMNLSLKGDLQRRQKQQSFHISVIQDNYNRSIEACSPRKTRQRLQIDNIPQKVVKENNNGRRREFARERATTKPDKIEKNQEVPQRQQKNNFPDRGQRREHKPAQPEKIQPNKDSTKNVNLRQIAARIEFLQAELEVRSKLKSMTGKMRKEKIDMQRQLEQLLSQ